MKTKFIDYREGSFIDYENKEHYFVVCAVLVEKTVDNHLVRILNLGISLCNPVDKNNNQLGKKIAYGKALSERNNNIILGRAGLLNIDTVRYILDNETNHVKQFPEQYSKAYADAKIKYEKAKSLGAIMRIKATDKE